METTRRATSDVLVSEVLANQIIDGLERIIEATTQLGDAVHTLSAPRTAPAAPVSAPAPADAIVWDVSQEALREYDAEQLLALRAAHRSVEHVPEDCAVCATLERRLGSL